MSDKELMTLAAKAAGFILDDAICTDEWLVIFSKVRDPLFGEPEALYWNQLTSNEDAFRLSLELGITVEVDYATQTANALWIDPRFKQAKCRDQISKFFGGGDLSEAARHVITRAAAEIGKAMP